MLIIATRRRTPWMFYVVGKQWMWKAQQPNGMKEITNARSRGPHVRLVLASEDVIHDFFVPAFR